MAATFLGSYTIGGAVVGLNAVFSAVGTALADLKAAVAVQLDIIDEQAALLLDAKAAIRIPATAEFEAQLNASIEISANIGVYLTDPTAYLTTLLDGIAQVQVDIGALVPAPALNAQLSANLDIQASLTAKIAAIDLQLEALVVINVALGAISAALQAALDAIAAQLQAFVSMTATLATAGAYVFRVDSALGSVGTDLDAVTPSSGLGAGVNVQIFVMFVQASDTPAVVATDAVFRTS